MNKPNCIFCKIAHNEMPSYTIYEDDDFKAILDISPASKGHTIIFPKAHYKNLFELDDDVASKILVAAKKISATLRDELNCDGFNLLQNNEEIAGQTVFHFHIHLIPRYKDDTIKFTTAPGKIDEAFAASLVEKMKSNF